METSLVTEMRRHARGRLRPTLQMLTGFTSTSTGDTSGTGNRTHSVTPAVGDLLIVIVGVANNSQTTPTVTDDQGGRYDLVGEAHCTISTIFTLTAHVRRKLVTTASSHTITADTGANDAGVVSSIRCTNMVRTGASAIRQKASASNGASGSAAETTYPSSPMGENSHVFAVLSAGGAITAPTGYTEEIDAAQTTPTLNLEVARLVSGKSLLTTTGGTASMATNWCAIALELDTSATVVKRRTGATTAATTGTTDRTHVATVEEHDLLIASCAMANVTWGSTNPVSANCTDSAGGTWTLLNYQHVTLSSGQATVAAWVRNTRVSAAEAGSLTITIDTTSNDAGIVNVSPFTGGHLAGSESVRQSAVGTGATSTSPAVTFGSALAAGGNCMFGMVVSEDTSSTPPATFVEGTDTNASTPTIAYENCILIDIAQVAVGSTVTWGATQSSAWAALVIEFQSIDSYARSMMMGCN